MPVFSEYPEDSGNADQVRHPRWRPDAARHQVQARHHRLCYRLRHDDRPAAAHEHSRPRWAFASLDICGPDRAPIWGCRSLPCRICSRLPVRALRCFCYMPVAIKQHVDCIRLHCPQARSGFLADRGNARSCGSGVEHINAPAYRMKTRGSPGTWAPRHQECLDCGGSVAFAVSDMTRLAADDSERVLWVEPSRFGHG